MKLRRRIAIVRRQVEQLAAIAKARAALSDGYRGDNRFRMLGEAETEAIVGVDLLTALAGAGRRD